MITLSKSQAKDAARQAGIELLILWPAELGPDPEDLNENEERDASPTEIACAHQLLVQACTLHALRIETVHVARVYRTKNLLVASGEIRTHLAVTLVGRRWRHPTGNPVIRWAQ